MEDENTPTLIEKWILEHALINNHLTLAAKTIDDSSFSHGKYKLHWLLASLHLIVDSKSYADFNTAAKIVKLIEHQNNQLQIERHTMVTHKEVFELVTLLRALSLLSHIGLATSECVLQMLNDLFPPQTNRRQNATNLVDMNGLEEGVPNENHVQDQDTLQQCAREQPEKREHLQSLASSMYPCVRQYVLNVLVHPNKQQHFHEHKFPQTFHALCERVQYLAMQYIHNMYSTLFSDNIQMLSVSRASVLQQIGPEVSVYFYTETIAEGDVPSSDQLGAFITALRHNRLQQSVQTPDLLATFHPPQAPVPESGSVEGDEGEERTSKDQTDQPVVDTEHAKCASSSRSGEDGESAVVSRPTRLSMGVVHTLEISSTSNTDQSNVNEPQTSVQGPEAVLPSTKRRGRPKGRMGQSTIVARAKRVVKPRQAPANSKVARHSRPTSAHRHRQAKIKLNIPSRNRARARPASAADHDHMDSDQALATQYGLKECSVLLDRLTQAQLAEYIELE